MVSPNTLEDVLDELYQNIMASPSLCYITIPCMNSSPIDTLTNSAVSTLSEFLSMTTIPPLWCIVLFNCIARYTVGSHAKFVYIYMICRLFVSVNSATPGSRFFTSSLMYSPISVSPLKFHITPVNWRLRRSSRASCWLIMLLYPAFLLPALGSWVGSLRPDCDTCMCAAVGSFGVGGGLASHKIELALLLACDQRLGMVPRVVSLHLTGRTH